MTDKIMENMAKYYIHEIPEGYEARIEGNKVIIELRESEDERIRKGLVKLLTVASEAYLVESTGIKKDSYLAYLEKQKEPHYTKRNALFDKCVAECDPAVMKEVSDEIDEMLEKEQKPASTEDMPYITDEHFFEREPKDSFRYKLAEYMTKNSRKEESPDGYTYHISAETILEMAKEELLKRGVVQKPNIDICPHSIKSKSYKENGYPIENCDYGLEIAENILKKTLGKIEGYQSDDGIREHQTAIEAVRKANEQKPAGWSEEDEDKLEQCIRIVSGWEGDYDIVKSPYSNFLKSLRPQPKRDGGDDYNKGYIKGRADTLKEFDDMPHWKPSEEQMEALKCAVSDVAKFSKRGGRQVELENEPYYSALHSLYCNLEKLM